MPSLRVLPSRALLHPLWWAALALLLANDHWLKRSPGVSPLLTGKLSDVSGLLMAPAAFAVLLRVRTLGGWLACHASTAAAFALLKLSAVSAQGFVAMGALFGLRYAVAPDPSDLWALGAVVVSLFVFARAGDEQAVSRAWARVVQGAGMAVGLVGTVATSRVDHERVAITPNEVYVIPPRPGDDPAYRTVDVLDAATGRHVRSVPFDADPDDTGEFADGILTMGDGSVLDLTTGRTRFRLPIGESAIGIDGRRWIGCLDEGTIAAFDVDRGSLVWKRALSCDSDQARLSKGIIALFDGQDHAELVEAATGRSLGRPFIDCPRSLFGRAFCYQPLIELPVFHPEFRDFHFEAQWTRADPEIVRADAAPLLVWTYTPNAQRLTAFRPGARAPLWAVPAGTLVLTAPDLVVTSNVGKDHEGMLEGRDAWTGALRWSYEYKPSYATYAANDTTLVLGMLPTEVVALDQRSGKKLWATDLASITPRTPDRARESR